jgi:hypothetical protein
LAVTQGMQYHPLMFLPIHHPSGGAGLDALP